MAAWQSKEPDAIAALFTEDATYAYSPWKEPVRGIDAIVADWVADHDPPDSWSASYTAAYVAGDVAIIKGETTYLAERHRYANLFEVTFRDGRCRSFVDWHMRMPIDA